MLIIALAEFKPAELVTSSLHRETLSRAPVTWMKVTVNRHVFYRQQVRLLPVLLSLIRSVVTQQLSEASSLRVLSV